MTDKSHRMYRDKNVMGRFIESVYKAADDYDGPVRLMGIECGGVHTTLRIYEYMRDAIKDVGYFSIDVSRKDSEIKNRKNVEKELSVYPDFLKDSLLIAVDDIVLDGTTISIVRKEVGEFFRPKFGVRDFKYAAVVSSTAEDKKPYADIYGTLVDDVDRREYTKSLHLPPHLKGFDLPEQSHADKYVSAVNSYVDKIGRKFRQVGRLKERLILMFLQKNRESVSELLKKLDEDADNPDQMKLFS